MSSGPANSRQQQQLPPGGWCALVSAASSCGSGMLAAVSGVCVGSACMRLGNAGVVALAPAHAPARASAPAAKVLLLLLPPSNCYYGSLDPPFLHALLPAVSPVSVCLYV